MRNIKHNGSFDRRETGMAHLRFATKEAWAMFLLIK